jgi:hypothetical protein
MNDTRNTGWKRFPIKSYPNLCPWFQDRSDSLTDELKNFAYYVGLDADEENARKQLISDVTEAITAKWPKAIVNVFGSYASNLSTFLSDIDVSVLGMGVDEPNGDEMDFSASADAAAAVLTVPSSSNRGVANVKPPADVIDLCDDSDSAASEVGWVIDRTSTSSSRVVVEIDDSSSESDDNDVLHGSDSDDSVLDWTVDRAASSSMVVSDDTASDANDGSPVVLTRKRPRADVIDVDLHLNITALAAKTTSDVTFSRHSNAQSSSTATAIESSATRRSYKPSRNDILENKKRRAALLKVLFSHVKVLDWMLEGEFRSKAKVPIIYITHRSGIGIDVSMGVTAEDTTALVAQLKGIDAESFVVLSSFLKAFLFLLSLDKPFSGGTVNCCSSIV